MNRIQLIVGWVVLAAVTLFFGMGWVLALSLAVLWYFIAGINIINEWERRPVLLFGRYMETAGPGLRFIEPLFHTTMGDYSVQDRTVEVEVGAVQTKDNVNISLIGVLTYRIDPAKVKEAVVEVEDVDDSLLERALATLVDQAGKADLDHVLSERDQFSTDLVAKLKGRVATWGLDIKAFEIKEVEINDEAVEQAIAMKARAEKEGAAELVRAGYQQRVAEALNKAAGTYDDKGRWLKGMEVLVELSRSAQNNTIVIPSDLTGMLAGLASTAKPAGAGETKS